MKFLYVFFSMLLIVRRNMLGLFDAAHGFRARVPDRDSAFLGELMDDFDELFAALFGQRRGGEEKEVAVRLRRACGIASRPSSANLWTTLTSSLRRSSVSGGIGMRMTLPSFDGVSPRSDARMPDRKSTRLNSS